MHRIVPFLLISASLLFAKPYANISLTTSYNKASDSYYLSYSRYFYGIRTGILLSNNKELQFAYEQGNNVNCKGLDLKRFYLNSVHYFNSPTYQISPYLMLNGGYETSTIHYHKPNQLFLGLGGGVRINFHLPFYTYLESRLFQRLKTGDTDLIMTLGLAYQLETETLPNLPKIATHATTPQTYTPMQPAEAPAPELTEEKHVIIKPHISHTAIHTHYYVQLGVYAQTDPRALVRKARKRGFHINIRHIQRGGKKMKLILAGPYNSKMQAKRKLPGLRKIVPDAFIIRR